MTKIKTLTKMCFIFCALAYSFSWPIRLTAMHTAIPTPLFQLNAHDLPVHNWVKTLNTSMSTGLCQAGSHWRNCYDMTSDQCIELIHSLTQGCTTRIIATLPSTLTPGVASLAGQQVGFCVGELFHQLAQDRLKSIPECQK